MKKLFSVFLTLMLLCPAIAGAETITTNGGISLDTADLPYCTTDSDASVVYYIIGIPDTLRAFAIFPFGYPAEERKQQDRYDESRIHWVE